MGRSRNNKRKRSRSAAQSQPPQKIGVGADEDVIVLSDEDGFANDSFATMSAARWFDTEEVVTVSDDEEYQRMADEVASGQSSSSSYDGSSPSSSSTDPANIFDKGVPISGMNKTGGLRAVITEELTVFSNFQAIMPELPLDCQRPQGEEHRDAFPFKGQKRRGESGYMRIVRGQERNHRNNVYRHGFKRNTPFHGSAADYGLRRNGGRPHAASRNRSWAAAGPGRVLGTGYVVPPGASSYMPQPQAHFFRR